MATFKTNQISSDFEEYIRDLLECPVCMEIIKSVPVYQCINGHVICMDCIKELNSCPICRNNSAPARSLKLEKIIQKLEGIPPENEGPTTAKPNLQKWGKGSVRYYGTINGTNREHRIEINLNGAALRGERGEINIGLILCKNLGRFILFCFSWCCIYLLYFFIKFILGL